jgi:hypothetical protein
MKSIISIIFIAFATLAQAKTVSCFTKFFGQNKNTTASLVIQIDQATKNTNSVLTVADKRYNGVVYEGFIVKSQGALIKQTKGKYPGYLSLDLGKDSNRSIYSKYEAILPKNMGSNFKITVIERQYDSYNFNNEYYSMLCRAQ